MPNICQKVGDANDINFYSISFYVTQIQCYTGHMQNHCDFVKYVDQ